MENIEMNNAAIAAIEEPVLNETEITTTVPEIPEAPNANVDTVNVTPEPVAVQTLDLASTMMAVIGGATVLFGAGYILYKGCKWGKRKISDKKAAWAAKKEAKRQAKIVKIETVPEQNSSDEENFEEVDD